MLSPPPDIVPKILDDLCDPDLTLREIAMKAQTTVEALSLWMASPDIAARIELIQSTIAQRTRLAATCFLPAAVRTVNRVLEAYEHEEDHVPIKPGSLIGHEYRRRSRESARRAANLLLQLARFNHIPSHRPRPCHRLGGLCRHACAHTTTDPVCGRAHVPDLLAIRASRLSGNAQRSDHPSAPTTLSASELIASAGAAGGGAEPPASSSSLPPHAQASPPVVDISLAVLNYGPSLTPGVRQPAYTNGHHAHNGNGATNNEHWP